MPPLALYIHWPFCKAKCPYCDFNSHVREGVEEAQWQQAMLTELRHMHALSPQHTLSSIFFGGGTPSLMPPALVAALIDEACRLWPVEKDVEITLEANPTSVEAAKFQGFKTAGVNRVSLGVQSLRDDDLKFLGRHHSAKEALEAVALAASIFDRYSFDLIYARPNQTASEWERELREALHHAGDHLSLYQLTIEENTAFHHSYYHKGLFSLPPEEEGAELFLLTQTIMEEAGLPAYEISNHAKPGQESRHNLAYWRGLAYAGVGPGAHGRLLLDGTWHATATLKSPERWLERVQQQGHALEVVEPMRPIEREEEQFLMGLRLREGLKLVSFEHLLDHRKLVLYQAQGLLHIDHERLYATPHKGWLVLNTLLAELLA